MDSFQFLDFDGLSEGEIKELVSYLHTPNVNVELPWLKQKLNQNKAAGAKCLTNRRPQNCEAPPKHANFPQPCFPGSGPDQRNQSLLSNPVVYHTQSPVSNVNIIYPVATSGNYFPGIPLNSAGVSHSQMVCPVYSVQGLHVPKNRTYPYIPVTAASPTFTLSNVMLSPTTHNMTYAVPQNNPNNSPTEETHSADPSETSTNVANLHIVHHIGPNTLPSKENFQPEPARFKQNGPEAKINVNLHMICHNERSDGKTHNLNIPGHFTLNIQNNTCYNDEQQKQPQMPQAKQQKSMCWAALFKKTEETESNVENGTSAAVYKTEIAKEDNLCPFKNPASSDFIDPIMYQLGEYLSQYTIDSKPVSIEPRGLINRSNYCYINSILQALLFCPPMYHLLNDLSTILTREHKGGPQILQKMCQFVKEFSLIDVKVSHRKGEKNARRNQNININYGTSFEPSYIHKVLNGKSGDSFLVEGRQEDAEEFLGVLLNSLSDEMSELMKLVKGESLKKPCAEDFNDDESDKEWLVMGKKKGSITRVTDFERTPIIDIFCGLLKSRIHKSGEHPTDNIQPFFALQLNIEKANNVHEALEQLTLKHAIEGVTCSKTNKQVEAWQQTSIEELPIILILHLKCFDYMNGCTKIIKALEFPIDLKIDPKILSSNKTSPKDKQYKLFSVVYHDGKEASKGHYLTDVYHKGYGTWLRYDDSLIKPVHDEQVLKPQGNRVPYLLFYRRSDRNK